jgi:hypothetical protein
MKYPRHCQGPGAPIANYHCGFWMCFQSTCHPFLLLKFSCVCRRLGKQVSAIHHLCLTTRRLSPLGNPPDPCTLRSTRCSRPKIISFCCSAYTTLTPLLAMTQKIPIPSRTHVHLSLTGSPLVLGPRIKPPPESVLSLPKRELDVPQGLVLESRSPEIVSGSFLILSATLPFHLPSCHKLHGMPLTTNLDRTNSMATSQSGWVRTTDGNVPQS